MGISRQHSLTQNHSALQSNCPHLKRLQRLSVIYNKSDSLRSGSRFVQSRVLQ